MNDVINKIITGTIPRITGTRNRQRLSILIYHRVLEAFDFMRPSEPTAEQFDWQIEALAKHFCPLSLTDALQLMDREALPDRAVCVTFDDGYRDNLENALPILQKWRVSATVFVSTGFLDGGRMWNDTIIEAARLSEQPALDLSQLGLGPYPLDSMTARKKSASEIIGKLKYLSLAERKAATSLVEEQAGTPLPPDLMLSTKQLKQLCGAGVEIGAHTHAHPILASLAEDQAWEEINIGKKILQDKLGKPVRYFAYPNGSPGKDYHAVHRKMVSEAGFSAALSTQWGVSNRFTDRFQLARFTPWDKTSRRFITRLLLNQRNLVVEG